MGVTYSGRNLSCLLDPTPIELSIVVVFSGRGGRCSTLKYTVYDFVDLVQHDEKFWGATFCIFVSMHLMYIISYEVMSVEAALLF